jgi:hydroxylamine reductase (hybrid-cluster protein)
MARKDDILKSFLTHDLLENKYGYNIEELPTTVKEALFSDKPIIKAIALIIDGLDGTSPVTDTVLRNQVTQFLNEVL